MPGTQTVTVLFTDVVGSTELASSLEPAAADRVRQEHFSFLRQALAANEGIEVKNLGDGIMAAFPSPSAAISCAVAMQQAVDDANRRAPHTLGLRVGLSGGEVMVEDGDYFGDPVVEAARVCALCEGGQILVTDAVRFMVGRRCAHSRITIVDLGAIVPTRGRERR
jgi:class 3 adenylate cyclase